MAWCDSAAEVQSLGSQATRPGSLAGLHEARRQHLGQFFTPDAVAAFMWEIAQRAMARARRDGMNGAFALLDNSVGSGRLLQFADPKEHILGGIDVHAESITELVRCAEAAGFMREFQHCGMENALPSNYHIALINPPFSIHLESPHLTPGPSTVWGRYGQNTAARSHAYAVDQALLAAQVVLAIAPSTFADEVMASKKYYRLAAVLDLPAGSFRAEGTEVSTSLLLFGHDSVPTSSRRRYALGSLTIPADLPELRMARVYGKAGIHVHGFEADEPAITLPVTGKKTVRIVHDSRRIGLKFECGAVQAKVLNAVYECRLAEVALEGHRYPKGLRFNGEWRLDLEAHLAQADPQASFDGLVKLVRRAGGRPKVDAGLQGYLSRRIHRLAREKAGFIHDVYRPKGIVGTGTTGKASKTFPLDPKVWGSPVIRVGEEVAFQREGGVYTFTRGVSTYSMNSDEVAAHFDVLTSSEPAWERVEDGLVAKFPEQANQIFASMRRQGIDKWLYKDDTGEDSYQVKDTAELLLKRNGICAWTMALGKTRLDASLILASGVKHGLIVVRGYLVPVIRKQFAEALGLPEDLWKVIETTDDLKDLRRLNIISYSTLRSPVCPGAGRRTFAKLMRRRFGMVVGDEGNLLSNLDSDQSRALVALSPRRRYILTGSPIANYPRNLLPLLNYVGGDATAAQPYGWRRYYLDEDFGRTGLSRAVRGIDQFASDFVQVEWSTQEFREDLGKGAKREVPKLNNLVAFRELIGRHTIRRVKQEPQVRRFVRIPEPDEDVLDVRWDDAHLAYYLRVAEDFMSWYQNQRRLEGKRSNLIAVLARIGAVDFAANFPQKGHTRFGAYTALTSKQKAVLVRLKQNTKQGHRTVLFAKNPGNLDLMHRHLKKAGIDSLVFHGGTGSIEQRNEELYERFVDGDCPNLLASHGVTEFGYDLPQADRAILLGRAWVYETENQLISRLLRPQQTRQVLATRVHLPGSIDHYQDMLLKFKKDTAMAGLDWADPQMRDEEFLHLDTVLGRFCEDLTKLLGVDRRDLRKALEAA